MIPEMAFPATRWTILAQATLSGDDSGRKALDELCSIYWQPVFEFCRLSGWSKEDAEDLTQRFFIYLMDRSMVRRADQERGTFRAFLKTILRRFLSDEIAARRAFKRGGGATHQSVESAALELPVEEQWEEEFDRRWAFSALDAAIQAVMADYQSRRDDGSAALIRPFVGGEGELVSYEEAASRIGLSLSAFKSEVRLLRQRLRKRLKTEVMRTVSAPGEFDSEFSYLRQLLS